MSMDFYDSKALRREDSGEFGNAIVVSLRQRARNFSQRASCAGGSATR
jgi:hypothetical protein